MKWHQFVLQKLEMLAENWSRLRFKDSYTYSRVIDDLAAEIKRWVPVFGDLESIPATEQARVIKSLESLMKPDASWNDEIRKVLNLHAERKGLLYIVAGRSAIEPVIDELTRKMAAAYAQSVPVRPTRGFHVCFCGVFSDNCEHVLPDGQETNSLCVHYLAYHRADISERQLALVHNLQCGEIDPTPYLMRPQARD